MRKLYKGYALIYNLSKDIYDICVYLFIKVNLVDVTIVSMLDTLL